VPPGGSVTASVLVRVTDSTGRMGVVVVTFAGSDDT
jgi:hypothetical protein